MQLSAGNVWVLTFIWVLLGLVLLKTLGKLSTAFKLSNNHLALDRLDKNPKQNLKKEFAFQTRPGANRSNSLVQSYRGRDDSCRTDAVIKNPLIVKGSDGAIVFLQT